MKAAPIHKGSSRSKNKEQKLKLQHRTSSFLEDKGEYSGDCCCLKKDKLHSWVI